MDPKELHDRQQAVEETAESLKRAVPRITLLNEPLRHHDGDGSLTADSADQPDEDAQA